MHLLLTEFDYPEVTLCSWQDIKIQLLTYSCQPLLGVNLSPQFVNLYFPYTVRFCFVFFAGGSGILYSTQHVWQCKEEAMCEIHMHNFKSHFQQDFLACCTRPVSVHLATACVSCSFNSFSIFLLSLKQQQNIVKIILSSVHFPVWSSPPKIMGGEKSILYQ